VEAPIVDVVDFSNLLVQTPPGEGGEVDVVVENPDGERAGGLNFTYVSNPKVTGVFENLNDLQVADVSVTGGDVVRIKGSGFMPGARIVVGPQLTPAGADASGDLLYKAIMKAVTLLERTLNSNELDPFLLAEGIEAPAEFIDSMTLRVTMPPAGLESRGLIVINPDGGVSEQYTGLEYGLPSVQPPEGVTAEIVTDTQNDRDLYIRVTWSPEPQAKAYEVYVVEDGTQTLVGTTEGAVFIFTRLKPRTEYWFIIKSIGEYLFSEPSRESNTVRTGRNVGPQTVDPGLGEVTTQIKQGSTANITVGTEDAKIPLVVDLTRGTLTGATEVSLLLPAQVVYSAASANIEVRGVDFYVKLNPSAFRVQQLESGRDDKSAGVKVTIAPRLAPGIPSPAGGLSAAYLLEASAYQGAQTQKLEYIGQNIEFALLYDQARAQMRRANYPTLYWYDSYTRQWTTGYNWNLAYNGQSVLINRMGQYAVMNRR
jgi:hypothetical protein